MVCPVHKLIESRTRLFSVVFILCATGLLAVVVLLPASGKIAVVESTFGIFLLLLAVSLMKPKGVVSERPGAWFRYVPLAIGIGVDLLSPFFQPIVGAVALACALTCLLPLSQMKQVSRNYFLLLATFLAASIAYNVFYYYPLDIGIDSWGYLSVSSAIIQTGSFTYVNQPTSEYYWPFPVVSLVTSALSLVSGLTLPVSLFIFPGTLILLQPMLVFLVTRRLFDAESASVSAFVVLFESAVLQWLGAPIAESVAISLMLLLLLLLSIDGRNRQKMALTFVMFLVMVAVHGSVALVMLILGAYLSLRKTAVQVRSVATLVAIFLVYQLISLVIDTMVFAINDAVQILLQFFFAPSVPRITAFSIGTEGILFVWWGLAPALAMFSFFMKRKNPANLWVVAGAGLLGLSFIANVIAPNIYLDRYTGLAGWLILAATGGHTLRGLTKSSRRLGLLLPLILLVSFSAVVYPAMSPQFGFAPPAILSTNYADRAALQIANTYGGDNYRIIGDVHSMSYLTFIRYQSGRLTTEGFDNFPRNVTNPYPEANSLNLIRWSITDVTSPNSPCSGLTSYLVNDTVNIFFNNSCDIFATPAD